MEINIGALPDPAAGYTETAVTAEALAVGDCCPDAHRAPSAWTVWRRAATVLMGGRHPEVGDVRCRRCGAEPGVVCAPRALHAPRLDRRSAAWNAYHHVTYELADAAYCVVTGGSPLHPVQCSRKTLRSLERLVAGSGLVYVLPYPQDVLQFARSAGVEWDPRRVSL